MALGPAVLALAPFAFDRFAFVPFAFDPFVFALALFAPLRPPRPLPLRASRAASSSSACSSVTVSGSCSLRSDALVLPCLT